MSKRRGYPKEKKPKRHPANPKEKKWVKLEGYFRNMKQAAEKEYEEKA